MGPRTTGALVILLLGLGNAGGSAFAQYNPPPAAYPSSPGYTPQRLIPADANGEKFYDAKGRMLPPGTVYREAPPGYREVSPQGYSLQSPQGSEPAAPTEQEATRPPMPLAPGQTNQGATSADGTNMMAAFPPEVRPETGPTKELPQQFRRTLVDYYSKEPAGTIIIDTPNTYLYLVLGNGKALRYGVGVGREGFTWSGVQQVTRMAEWPDWNPPEEMIVRQPYLPRFMAGGETNPLGARALYLGKTVYRIHGTNQPSTIGTFVSSGCIRLTNNDVTDLYSRVKVGTRVVVLPGKPPATASATPPAGVTAPSAGSGAVTAQPLAPPSSAMTR
jgi:lipoprotein-anchoring transpeptidase ErfK/SrfK